MRVTSRYWEIPTEKSGTPGTFQCCAFEMWPLRTSPWNFLLASKETLMGEFAWNLSQSMGGTLILQTLWNIRFANPTATRETLITSPRPLLTLWREYGKYRTKRSPSRDKTLQSRPDWVVNWWKGLLVKSSQRRKAVYGPPSVRARSHRTQKKLLIQEEHSKGWGLTLEINLRIPRLQMRSGTVGPRKTHHNRAHSAIWCRVEYIWKLSRKSQYSRSDSGLRACRRLRIHQKQAR
jgi:hypothetical protein